MLPFLVNRKYIVADTVLPLVNISEQIPRKLTTRAPEPGGTKGCLPSRGSSRLAERAGTTLHLDQARPSRPPRARTLRGRGHTVTHPIGRQGPHTTHTRDGDKENALVGTPGRSTRAQPALPAERSGMARYGILLGGAAQPAGHPPGQAATTVFPRPRPAPAAGPARPLTWVTAAARPAAEEPAALCSAQRRRRRRTKCALPLATQSKAGRGAYWLAGGSGGKSGVRWGGTELQMPLIDWLKGWSEDSETSAHGQ